MGKAKFRPKKVAVFFVIIIFSFSVMYFVASKDVAYSFAIPTAPYRFVGAGQDAGFSGQGSTSPSGSTTSGSTSGSTTNLGFQGNVRNEFIFCAISAKMNVIDNNGKVIATESSAFFYGNPWTTFSLIDDSTGKDIGEGGLDLLPSAKCQTSGQAIPESSNDPSSFDLFNFPSVEIPLTIKASDLFVRVYSRDPAGSLIETFNAKLRTNEIKVTDPSEKQLGKLFIGSDRLLAYLPDGQYPSWQHVTLEGTIDVHWTNYPDVIYRYTLEKEEKFDSNNKRSDIKADIITYRLINVDKSIDDTIPAKSPEDCLADEVFLNGFCVKKSSAGSPLPNDPNVTNIPNQLNDLIAKFSLCVQTQGIGCFFTQEYIGFSFLIIGTMVVAVGSAVGASSPKIKDVYGFPNPRAYYQ